MYRSTIGIQGIQTNYANIVTLTLKHKVKHNSQHFNLKSWTPIIRVIFKRFYYVRVHHTLNSQEFIQLHIRLNFQFNLSDQSSFVTRSPGQLCGNSIQISAPLLRETTTSGKKIRNTSITFFQENQITTTQPFETIIWKAGSRTTHDIFVCYLHVIFFLLLCIIPTPLYLYHS